MWIVTDAMGRNTRDASLETFHRNSNDIQMFYNRSDGSRGDDATGDVCYPRSIRINAANSPAKPNECLREQLSQYR